VSEAREWSLAEAIDVITDAVGDRELIVWNDVRRSHREVQERSRALARWFAGHSLGLQRERDQIERWECGQSTIALVMGNRPEYLEAMYAAFRARAVPFNVNHHYRPAEVGAVFDMLRVDAVVYARALGPLVLAALEGRDALLVDIDDGSGVERLAGATDLEGAIGSSGSHDLPTPSPDDLYIVCTGGTTGAPKAVLWRQGDAFISAMAGAEGLSPAQLAERVAAGGGRWFAAPPLMHAAAQWTAFCGIHSGGTVLLHDDTWQFDASAVLGVAERERATLMSIVGDAYARPMIDELRRRTYDLSSLTNLGVGGAVTSEACKVELLELLPHLLIVDGYGASETGGMAFGPRAAGGSRRGFSPGSGAIVLSEDRRRILDATDESVGWAARRARVPLGYLGHREATEATFPEVSGQRFAVPGDRAQYLPDGSIAILGRDSMVVNTGGEKVFVEEVEEALRSHPAVTDALVVGRPSDRFGYEVVGVVQLRPDVVVHPNELREHCATTLARFKAPRAIAFVDLVGRHASGKPDYQWAHTAAADAVDATGG
jgi:fatty-acyl-CoA synthase